MTEQGDSSGGVHEGVSLMRLAAIVAMGSADFHHHWSEKKHEVTLGGVDNVVTQETRFEYLNQSSGVRVYIQHNQSDSDFVMAWVVKVVSANQYMLHEKGWATTEGLLDEHPECAVGSPTSSMFELLVPMTCIDSPTQCHFFEVTYPLAKHVKVTASPPQVKKLVSMIDNVARTKGVLQSVQLDGSSNGPFDICDWVLRDAKGYALVPASTDFVRDDARVIVYPGGVWVEAMVDSFLCSTGMVPREQLVDYLMSLGEPIGVVEDAVPAKPWDAWPDEMWPLTSAQRDDILQTVVGTIEHYDHGTLLGIVEDYMKQEFAEYDDTQVVGEYMECLAMESIYIDEYGVTEDGSASVHDGTVFGEMLAKHMSS